MEFPWENKLVWKEMKFYFKMKLKIYHVLAGNQLLLISSL